MSESQTLNYYTPVARPQTPVQRPTKPDWLQAWLKGETPDAAILELHGFQAQLYYSLVIYRAADDSVTGTQFAALLQAEAVRRGITGTVLVHVLAAVLFHLVEELNTT